MLNKKTIPAHVFSCCCFHFESLNSFARDLAEIKKEGVLRHIGAPYAQFLTRYYVGNELKIGGLDSELIKGFAKHLGVQYQYVPAEWATLYTHLTGQNTTYVEHRIERSSSHYEIKGDLIANGMTILPWRQEVVDFSTPYFPTSIWLVANSHSQLSPIKPSGKNTEDIRHVKKQLNDIKLVGMENTSLDPALYDLSDTGAKIVLTNGVININEMVPAILNNLGESTLLDSIDSLDALRRWPGKLKVIGPISDEQRLGVAFRKSSPELRKAFNQYFQTFQQSGQYNQLVQKYYPDSFHFYPHFFNVKAHL